MASAYVGAFELELGHESTIPIPYNATSEEVANALENLLSVEAVSVQRLETSSVGEFSWLITFFSLRSSLAANVSQLGIAPILSNSDSKSITYSRLFVETVKDGSGSPRLYRIDTYALQVDAIYVLSAKFSGGIPGSFSLRVQWEAELLVVGPIFEGTVASTVDEIVGPYPPHAQQEGTKVGQSLQSLLRTLPFLTSVAEDVVVERYSTGAEVRWQITFVQSSFVTLSIMPVNSSNVKISVTLLQSTNRVEGTTFTLSYGGYRTSLLDYNASSSAVEAALKSLPSITNGGTGIGNIVVGRRGPNSQGGYRWYVAFTQEPDIYYSHKLVASVESAEGIDTNIYAFLMREAVSMTGAGVMMRIGGALGGSVENMGGTSLFSPEPMMSFNCKLLADMYIALGNIVLIPPPQWDGGFQVEILIRANAISEVLKQVQVWYSPVNKAPELFLNGVGFNSTLVNIYEDIETALGNYSLVDWDSGGENISVALTARRGVLRIGEGLPVSPTHQISGNIDVINLLLPNVSYRTCAFCNGDDLITLFIYDGYNTVEFWITIAIIPVNNPPYISITNTSTYTTLYDNESSWSTGLFSISMNEAVNLNTMISVSDPDFNSSNLFYDDIAGPAFAFVNSLAFASNLVLFSISVEKGSIRMTGVTSSALVVAGDLQLGSPYAAIMGSIADIQEALYSLTYIPQVDWSGVDLMIINLDDRGNIGVGGNLINTRRILLRVEPMYFPPIILTPDQSILQTFEDTTGVIGQISSQGNSVIKMAVRSFQIRDRNVPTTDQKERVIVAVDTLQHSLYGSSESNFTYANASTGGIEAYTYETFNASNVNNSFTVRLQVYHGRLSLVDVPPSLEFLRGSGFLDDFMEFQGKLLDVNIALESIRYTPDINWNSFLSYTDATLIANSNENFDMNVTNSWGLSNFITIPIEVQAVNDPPVITLGYQSIEDSLLATGDQVSRRRTGVKPLLCTKNIACAILDIRLRDVDLDENSFGSVLLILRCSNGSFMVDASVNIAYPSLLHLNESIPRMLEVVVPSVGMPIVLKGLYYLADENFVGEDSIVISVNDMGNTGICFSGPCDLSDNLILPVNISDKEAAPSIFVKTSVFDVQSDTAVKIYGVSISSHRLEIIMPPDRVLVAGTENWDPPEFIRKVESKAPYLVRLSADTGLISLPLAYNVDFTMGGGINDAVVEFRASLEFANVALSTIIYVPFATVPGTTVNRILISVQDQLSGLYAEDEVIEINVTPSLIRPQVNVMGEQYPSSHSTPFIFPSLIDILVLETQEDNSISLELIYVSLSAPTVATLLLNVSALHGVFESSDIVTSRVLQLQPSGKLSLYGDFQYFNSLLSMTAYRPDRNYNGPDVISVTCCSPPYKSSEVCSSRDIPVLIQPVNDPPYWSVLSTVAEISQDSAVSLGFFANPHDIDSTNLLVTVTVSAGSLVFTSDRALVTFVDELLDPSPTAKFYVATESASTVVNGLLFFPPVGWNSQDEQGVIIVKLYAEDVESPSLPAAATLAVVVTKTHQRNPFFHLPGATYRGSPCDSQALLQGDMVYSRDMLCDSIVAVTPSIVTLNTPTILCNISLYFTDSLLHHPDIFELCAFAIHGALEFRNAKILGIDVTIDSRGRQCIMGPTDLLNLALSDLEYFSNSSSLMSDEVSLGVRNIAPSSPGQWTNVTLPITLIMPELLLKVMSTEMHVSVLEDQAVSLGRSSLIFTTELGARVHDASYVEQQGFIARVGMYSNHGYLLLKLRGLNVTLMKANYTVEEEVYEAEYLQYPSSYYSSYQWSTHFIIEGSVEQLNRALATLLYRPSLNWNSQLGPGIELDTLNFSAGFLNAYGNELGESTVSLMTIMVFAVNDRPNIETPYDIYSGTQWTGDLLTHTTIGTEPIFVTMNEAVMLPGILVSDVDLGAQGIAKVSLTCTNGMVSILNQLEVPSLSLPRQSLGLVFFRGTGLNDTTMEFSASVAVLNQALSLITFAPNLDFNGFGASLEITVDDLGGYGLGGRMTEARVLNIIVAQRNIPPNIALPTGSGISMFIVDEGSQLRISGAIPGLVESDYSSSAIGYELFAYYEPTLYSGEQGPARFDANRISFADIYLGNRSSHPTFFFSFNGELYFQADDGIHGTEIWRLALTTQENPSVPKEEMKIAPSLFADLMPGPLGSSPAYFTLHNGFMYFSCSGMGSECFFFRKLMYFRCRHKLDGTIRPQR